MVPFLSSSSHGVPVYMSRTSVWAPPTRAPAQSPTATRGAPLTIALAQRRRRRNDEAEPLCGSEKVASTKTEFPSFVRATSQGRLSVMLGDETASYREFSRSVPVYPRAQLPRASFAARRGVCGASHRPPLGVCLLLSLFAVPLRFSLRPSGIVPHLHPLVNFFF